MEGSPIAQFLVFHSIFTRSDARFLAIACNSYCPLSFNRIFPCTRCGISFSRIFLCSSLLFFSSFSSYCRLSSSCMFFVLHFCFWLIVIVSDRSFPTICICSSFSLIIALDIFNALYLSCSNCSCHVWMSRLLIWPLGIMKLLKTLFVNWLG